MTNTLKQAETLWLAHRDVEALAAYRKALPGLPPQMAKEAAQRIRTITRRLSRVG